MEGGLAPAGLAGYDGEKGMVAILPPRPPSSALTSFWLERIIIKWPAGCGSLRRAVAARLYPHASHSPHFDPPYYRPRMALACSAIRGTDESREPHASSAATSSDHPQARFR